MGFLLSTDFNLQKEYINTPFSMAVPGDFSYHTQEVPHNLGYIPSARVWYEPRAGEWYPLTLMQLSDSSSGSFVPSAGYYTLSTTSLYVSIANFTGSSSSVNVIARVYLDN